MNDTGCKQNRYIEKHGLKTLHSPKQVKEISAFEKDLIAEVKNIKFKNVRSDFQTTLQKDIRLVHNSEKTMTYANRASNIYRLTKEEHNKSIRTTVTSNYKKTNAKIKDKINKKGKEILKNKEVLSPLDVNEESNFFFSHSKIIKRVSKIAQDTAQKMMFSIKDLFRKCFLRIWSHLLKKSLMENFIFCPVTTRLINLTKNEIGRISKVILDKISLIEQLKWKNI